MKEAWGVGGPNRVRSLGVWSNLGLLGKLEGEELKGKMVPGVRGYGV